MVNLINQINPKHFSNNCKSNELNKSLNSCKAKPRVTVHQQQCWRVLTYNTNQQKHTKHTHCEHTNPISAQSLHNSSMMNSSHITQTTSHDNLQWKNNNNHHTNTHTHTYTNNINKTISFCNDDTEWHITVWCINHYYIHQPSPINNHHNKHPHNSRSTIPHSNIIQIYSIHSNHSTEPFYCLGHCA